VELPLGLVAWGTPATQSLPACPTLLDPGQFYKAPQVQALNARCNMVAATALQARNAVEPGTCRTFSSAALTSSRRSAPEAAGCLQQGLLYTLHVAPAGFGVYLLAHQGQQWHAGCGAHLGSWP
jgi:hypothetical protein